MIWWRAGACTASTACLVCVVCVCVCARCVYVSLTQIKWIKQTFKWPHLHSITNPSFKPWIFDYPPIYRSACVENVGERERSGDRGSGRGRQSEWWWKSVTEKAQRSKLHTLKLPTLCLKASWNRKWPLWTFSITYCASIWPCWHFLVFSYQSQPKAHQVFFV